MKERLSAEDLKQKRLDTGLSDEEMVKPLKTIYKRVIALAKKYPEVKGDYNLLVSRYQWYYHARGFGMSFKDLLKLESPESITRAFRKAVENTEIIPTGKILSRRSQREKAIKAAIHDLG